MSTKIEWTDITDNIIVAKPQGASEPYGWWCRKRSDACKNCYSDKMNQNPFWKGNGLSYSGEPPELVLKTDIIDNWPRQRLCQRHFVASMTDVFGEWLSPEWIERMLDGMAAAPNQEFQALSKREDIMYSRVMFWLAKRKLDHVPDHILLGQSVENQAMADLRIPMLLKIPGLHFLSVEPLLGPVDLSPWITPNGLRPWHQIDWVIVGGETGPNARPMHPDWVKSIRDQCQRAGIPFFFKQWGNYKPLCQVGDPNLELVNGTPKHRIILDITGSITAFQNTESVSQACAATNSWIVQRIGKKAAGRELDGQVWNDFPNTRFAAQAALGSALPPIPVSHNTSPRRSAALKAWKTIRNRYTSQELAHRHSVAAAKAWQTRRASK